MWVHTNDLITTMANPNQAEHPTQETYSCSTTTGKVST